MLTIAPMRVLVVDDSDDTATTMAFLLERYGHNAQIATGGEAALQQAPLFHPDVMFIDLAMPKVDGLTVARGLRQMPEFVATPLVAVSGYADPAHQAQAFDAGFNEFLAKPYTLDALRDTLKRGANQRVSRASRESETRSRAITAAHRRLPESSVTPVAQLHHSIEGRLGHV